MNISEVRKVVGTIKTSLFKSSNSYSTGMLKSNFRGSGLQFKEHRIYNHGDDTRFIDWKILAKTSTPFIKLFEEERNLEIVVLIDASPSMLYGYKDISKLQASIELCCLLYLLAEETNDYIHTFIISDEIISLPKSSGEEGVIRLISSLKEQDIIDGKGNINVLREFKNNVTNSDIKSLMMRYAKSKEIVVFSDFNGVISCEDIPKIKNVHLFRILSPLDEFNRWPYLVDYIDQSSSKKGIGYIFNKNENTKFLQKRIRNIRVDNKYLHQFIKEMI